MTTYVLYDGDWDMLKANSLIHASVEVTWRRKAFQHLHPTEILRMRMGSSWPLESVDPENVTLIGDETEEGAMQAPLKFMYWLGLPPEGVRLSSAVFRLLKSPCRVKITGSLRARRGLTVQLYRRGR